MNRFLRSTLVTTGLFFISLTSFSQFAQYTFTGNATATSQPTGATASAVGLGSGVNSINTTTTFRTDSWTTGGSLSNTNYYEITVTPDPGYRIDFTTFVFDLTSQTGGAGGPNNWSLRSSMDNYATSLDGGGTLRGNPLTNRSADVSGTAGATSAVTFRLFMWNAGNASGTVDLDNVKISGTISSVTPVTAVNSPLSFTGISNTGTTVTWGGPPAGNISLATTAAAGSSGTATLTFASQSSPPFPIGSKIFVSGVTPAGYNGSYTVTACTITTVSYSSGATGSQTVAGTISSVGSGTNRLVIASLNSAVSASPADGTTYTAGAYGVNAIGGNYVVYNGTGTNASVTGLGNGDYFYKVYTYDGAAGAEKYLTSSTVSGNQGTTPSAQPTSMTFTSPLADGTGYTVGWTAVSGVTGYIAIRKSGSAPTRTANTPVDGTTTYAVGNSLLGGTIAYIGTGTSFADTGLTAATDYFYDVYSYNGTGTGIVFLTGATPTPLANDKFTLAAEPTAQASNIAFSAVNTGAGTMTLTWANGTNPGNTRIVIGRDGSAVSYVPVDGASVPVVTAASLNITAAGSDITGFTGNHLLYSGSSNTINITNLVAGHQYYFQVFEVNGSGTTANYLTTTATLNPNSVLFLSQATGITFSNNTNTTIDVSFTNGGGSSRIVVARAGSAVNAFPSNGTSYTANAFGTAGSQIGTGNYVVSTTSGATVTGLTANTTYYFSVFENDGSNNYVLTPASGNDLTQNSPTANTPANQVTGLTTGTITSSAIPINWTGATGSPAPSKYLVLGRDVTASGTFATITQNAAVADQTNISLANAAQNITFGTNTASSWTNMVAGHQYEFAVYSYTTGGTLRSTADYLLTSPAIVSAYTEPGAQPTVLAFANVLPNSFDVSFTGEPTASGYVVLRSTTALPTNTPTDGTQYTVGGNIGGDLIVSVGSGTSFSETGLMPSTTYYYRVYAYSGPATTPNYLLTSPLGGSQATTAPSNTGTLVVGAGTILSTVSSLTVSQAAADALNPSFEFTVTDDAGSGGDLSRTKFSSITINLDAASTVASLSAVLAGADLYDGTNRLTGTVNASTIVFTPSTADGALGDIADNTSKTYQLRIWLKSALSAPLQISVDGQKFVFNITSSTSDLTPVATYSTLAASQTAQSATTGRNIIDVTATKLNFAVPASDVLLLNAMSPAVKVEATDIYGNRDLQNITSVDITSNGTLNSTPQTVALSSGIGTYSIIHSAIGSARTLSTANGAGLTNTTSGPFNITASAGSNIIVNAGFTYPQNIAYDTFQESIDITNSGSSLVVAKFDLQDGGNSLSDLDGAPTILSSLRLDLGSNFNYIRRIALYDAAGTTEIIGTEQAVSSQQITFSGLSITAADNTATPFTVRVSFKSAVVDNQSISFQVIATTSTAANVSSTFAATNAGGAITSTSGNNNKIEVLANRLRFVQQPTSTPVGNTMTPSPTIQALDALNNLDLDFNSIVPVISSGSLVVTPQNATFVSGLGTYNAIVHNASGSGIKLTTDFFTGPPFDDVSSAFTITGKSSDIVENGTLYSSDIPYNTMQESVNIVNSATSLIAAAFDIRDGGGSNDGDGQPTVLTNLTLDLGTNYGFIRRIALYDATGTNEISGTEQVVGSQTVLFSGLTLTAPHNGSTTFTVRVSFTTAVVDRQQFSIKINSATAQAGSSVFATANAGGAVSSTSSNINKIQVTASKLIFTAQPTTTDLLKTMSVVSLSAVDNLNNLDTDFGSSVNILSSGVMTVTPQTVTFGSGTGSYNSIVHSQTATGIQLITTNGSSLTNASSLAFNIVASNASDIVENTGFSYPQNIDYANAQEGTDIVNSATSVVAAKFDVRDGGGTTDNDAAPTNLTALSLDLGSNFGYIRRIALFDASGTNQLSGTTEQAVSSQIVSFSSLSISAADGATTSFTVRVSFTTAVADNQQFTIKINSTTTQPLVSSLFNVPNAGGAITSTALDNNRIEVIAKKLVFTTNLISPLLPGIAIDTQSGQGLPVIVARDLNNLLDVDYTTPVALSVPIPFTPVAPLTGINGVFSFPAGAFKYTTTGDGTITASSGSLTGVVSNPVTVQAGTASAVVAGAASPATISSLVNTSLAAVSVLNFDVTDDKPPVAPTSDDGLPTLFTKLVITQSPISSNNSPILSDWTQIIAGAELHRAGSTTVLGVVGSTTITFNAIPASVTGDMGFVDDNATKSYSIKIYLKTTMGGTLPSTVDGAKLGFDIFSTNFTMAANSTGFVGTSASSGSNNAIDVYATTLNFIAPTGNVPPPSLNAPYTNVKIEGVDANGNRDLNFTGAASTIREFKNIGNETMINGPVVGVTQFTAGLLDFAVSFPNFQFTTGTNNEDVSFNSIKAGSNLTCGSNYSTGAICGSIAANTIKLVASSESAIVGDPTFNFPPFINYINYQEATNIQNTGTSLEIARMLLVDGSRTSFSYGGFLITTNTSNDGTVVGDDDGAATNLTSITINITNPSNLRRIELWSGGSPVAGTEIDVTAIGAITSATTSYDFVFNGAPLITAIDNGISTLSVRASFRNTGPEVTDQNPIQLHIVAASVGGGSTFYPVGIAGVPGGLQSPAGVNLINVIATKLDFNYNGTPHQPASITGVNEPVLPAGIVYALDAFGILDIDVNSTAIVSAPSASPTGSFTFSGGILDLAAASLKYTASGDGTLLVTSNPSTGFISSTNTCTHVDAIQITGLANTGGSSGVPTAATTLQAGSQNAVLFGVQFRSTYNITSPGPDPKLSSFTVDFSRSNNSTFTNFRVYESTQASPTYGVAMTDVTSVGIGASVSAGTGNNLIINFPPAGRVYTPTQTTYTYYVVADVVSTVNGSTPNMQLSVTDNGTGTSTASNVTATAGSQTATVTGPVFSFASVQPPFLVSSYPALAQDNIQITQNRIELTFSVPVFSLDGKIKLTNVSNPADSAICLIDTAPSPNGDYQSNSAPSNAARPIIFKIPSGYLNPNTQYAITIAQGIFSASSKKGISDVNNNVFPGISYTGVLYFRTTNGAAPALLGSTSTANPPGVSVPDISVTSITSYGATLTGTFDKKGIAHFLVLSSAAIPSIAQIDGSTAIANAVARGSFPINATTTIAQSGNILPTSGSFPLTPSSLNVWVYAETTLEANHVSTVIKSAPYGGSPNFIEGTTGPTTTMPTPAANTNTPGGSNAAVTTNTQSIQFCSGSYQIINSPIIFYEGLTQTFSQPTVQTMNLVLPGGFVFDTSTDALGNPVYGNLTLQGADFLGTPGSLTFLSTTVLRITFTNTGNISKDQIILSNLRIYASVAATGDIFRLGGTSIPAFTDGTKVANLQARDAKVVNFNNSYSTSLGVKLPTALPSALETAIPDNVLPSLVTLTPFIPDSLFDRGPSSFSGQGITTNTLNLAGVTKDTPFNITITHTDQNGCISQNAVQYVVYDNKLGIKISDTDPSSAFTLNQGPYCATNPAFQINATIAAPSPGRVRYISFDNLTVYNLESLVSGFPANTGTAEISNTGPHAAIWTPIVQNLAKIVPPPGGSHTSLGFTYHDYTFDDENILNANTPYVYDLYKKPTSPNFNYGSTGGPNPVGLTGTYYSGGSLGKVELTGTFRNASNPQVVIRRRQNIEFYLPAVPIVELVTPYSSLDISDPNNAPGSGGIQAGPNNPGTMVYCEGGGLININGWPGATAGVSSGVFTIVDPQISGPSGVIFDVSASKTPVGFKDNGNGTATLDPSQLTISNGYKDLKIIYSFKENNSPCSSSGYQIIRITPNPTSNFSKVAVISSNTPTVTSFCVGHQVNFDAGTLSTIGQASGGTAPANSISNYDWNFGDINSSSNSATGATPNHTFSLAQSYSVNLVTTSNWGCKSLPAANPLATQSIQVGGIPTVDYRLTGVYMGQTFDFHSNNSTVSSNDFFGQIDWKFGDGGTATTSYPYDLSVLPQTGTKIDPQTHVPHQYTVGGGAGQRVIDMKVTSAIGCVNSLSLDNESKGFGLATATGNDNEKARTIIVLDRQTVGNSATGYYEDFSPTNPAPSVWQSWYASNSVNPLTFPLLPISWSKTTGAASDYGTIINIDPSILTGPEFWRTNNAKSYTPKERSALYSPSFDISALATPMISYNSIVNLQVSDGVILEYSTDNLNVADPAKVWRVLGNQIGEGVGWFTDRGIAAKPGFQSGNDFGWTGVANPNWIISKHTLDEIPNGSPALVPPIPPGNPLNVVFRFALASTSTDPSAYEGFALDNVRIGERTRTIMLENFASVSNPNSKEKIQNDAIALFYPAGTVGTRVIRINYHMNFPGSDPFNQDSPADPSSRGLYYGIETTPKSRMDGAPDPQDRDFSVWGNLTYGIRSLALAQADITITPTVIGGKVKVDVLVKSLLPIPINTILQVAIVEDAIPFGSLSTAQKAMIKSGENGTFEYVPKKFLPSAAGTRFGPMHPTGAGGLPITQTFSFEWEGDPSRLYAPANNLSVVVFVQQEGGIREVYQANNQPIPTDPGVVTGVEAIPAEDILVYPVPANQEMHIKLPGKLASPAMIQMVDQTGRITINDKIAVGTDSKTVNTSDLSSGVYILQIDVGNGNITRKKVMVVH